MSEKRFMIDSETELIYEPTRDTYMANDVVVDLLNQLNDENEHLKEYVADIENDVKMLESENEQLRKELQGDKDIYKPSNRPYRLIGTKRLFK